MRTFFLYLVLIAYPCLLCAQSQEREISEEWIQGLVNPDAEAPAHLDALYDFYLELARHPLNLNRADRQDLQELRLLGESQIQAFLIHRQEHGKLISIYELQAIPTWDLATIRRVRPFVRVGGGRELPRASLRKSFLAKGHQQVMLRYHQKLDAPPLADSLRGKVPNGNWFLRLRSSYSKLYSVGITLSQDVGEPWNPEGSPLPRPDFNSFHAVAYNQGKLNARSEEHTSELQGSSMPWLWATTRYSWGRACLWLEAFSWAREAKP